MDAAVLMTRFKPELRHDSSSPSIVPDFHWSTLRRPARYAFVYGDLRRVHRTALIASVGRESEWRHDELELAAHDLLQRLDAITG